MSSVSRSHQSLPAAGLGTRGWAGGRLGIPDPICWWLPQLQALLATLLVGEVSLVSLLVGRFQPWLESALNLSQHHPLLVQPLLEGLNTLYQGPWYLTQVSRSRPEMVTRFNQESNSSNKSMVMREGWRSNWEVNPYIRIRSSEGSQGQTWSSGHQASAE